MDKEIKAYQIDFENTQSTAFASPLSYRFYRKQESLAEIEMMNIVLQECPNTLSEVSFFS